MKLPVVVAKSAVSLGWIPRSQGSPYPMAHQRHPFISGPIRTTPSHSLASYTLSLTSRPTPDSYHAGELEGVGLRSPLLSSPRFGLLFYSYFIYLLFKKKF